jgi:hypothetical protein
MTSAWTDEKSVTFLGSQPDDPDDLPLAPPNGFIWIQGGGWYGDSEVYGIADVRVYSDGETLDFVITLGDAIKIRALLDRVIAEMTEAEAKAEGFDDEANG